MSRIGKLPVHLPAGVTVTVGEGNVVKVKGPLGELSQKVDPDITVAVEGNVVKVSRPTDQPRHRSMHGLYRALVHNMVVGVSEGFEIKQELVGVGYRVEAAGQVHAGVGKISFNEAQIKENIVDKLQQNVGKESADPSILDGKKMLLVENPDSREFLKKLFHI